MASTPAVTTTTTTSEQISSSSLLRSIMESEKQQQQQQRQPAVANLSSPSTSLSPSPPVVHVLIVGAGMAGLTCARTLIEETSNTATTNNINIKVTVLEASGKVGGRIQVDDDNDDGGFWPKDLPPLDIGAEYIHGTGTILTDYIHDFRNMGLLLPPPSSATTPTANGQFYRDDNNDDNNNDRAERDNGGHDNMGDHVDYGMDLSFFEECFITAHADGGPSETPTRREGKYGMYFLGRGDEYDGYGGRLLRYDHDDVRPLSNLLEYALDHDCDDPTISMEDAIWSASAANNGLSPELYHLFLAGYANTAVCTDLSDLSLSMMQRYEKHWDENEIHGDYRMPAHLGMYSVVQALTQYLLQTTQTTTPPRFRLHVNTPVTNITPIETNNDNHDERKKVKVTVQIPANNNNQEAKDDDDDDDDDDEVITLMVDHVVVSVPPPIIPLILHDNVLTEKKLQALHYVGYSNVVKVICLFQGPKTPLWPPKVQSIISGEGLFPEVWFKPAPPASNNNNNEQQQYPSYLAVFYVAADYAQEFIKQAQTKPKTQKIKKTNKLGNSSSNNKQEEVEYDWDLNQVADLCLSHLAHILSLQEDNPDHVVTENELRAELVKCRAYDWGSNPWIRGGHSYPRVGMTPQHLLDLAEPIQDCIYFCGEATNTNAACTIQAAMETGVRAAKQVLERIAIVPPKQQATATADAAGAPPNEGASNNDGGGSSSSSSNKYGDNAAVMELAALIQRQMQLSRSVAFCEEGSYQAMHEMGQRQLQLSRILADQEALSGQLVQTLEYLAKLNRQQEEGKKQIQLQLEHELETRCKERQEMRRISDQQAQQIQVLQEQIQLLSKALEERDSLIHSRSMVITELTDTIQSMNQEAKEKAAEMQKMMNTKDVQLRDRDAIIKIMAHKSKAAATKAEQAQAKAEQAQRMVHDRDAVIRIMAQKVKALTIAAEAAAQEEQSPQGRDDSDMRNSSPTVSEGGDGGDGNGCRIPASSSSSSSSSSSLSIRNDDPSVVSPPPKGFPLQMSPREKSLKQLKAKNEEKVQRLMRSMRQSASGGQPQVAGITAAGDSTVKRELALSNQSPASTVSTERSVSSG